MQERLATTPKEKLPFKIEKRRKKSFLINLIKKKKMFPYHVFKFVGNMASKFRHVSAKLISDWTRTVSR